MTCVELLADFRRRGVELFVEGDRLRFRGPKGALTPEMREAAAAHRAELLAAVSPSASPPGWDAERAAVVLNECERLVEAFLAGSPSGPQRNVAEVYRGLARRYADQWDELLWGTPEFLRAEFSKWRPSDGLPAPVDATWPPPVVLAPVDQVAFFENELMFVLSSLRESDARNLAKQAAASVDETQAALDRLVSRGEVLRFAEAAAPVYRNATTSDTDGVKR